MGIPLAMKDPRHDLSHGVSFISPEQLDHLLRTDGTRLVLVDVREPVEHSFCRIEGSILIPLSELPRRATELNPNKTIVVYCHYGIRSLQAARCLRSLGFTKVICLSGGIDAWTKRIDPSLPCY